LQETRIKGIDKKPMPFPSNEEVFRTMNELLLQAVRKKEKSADPHNNLPKARKKPKASK